MNPLVEFFRQGQTDRTGRIGLEAEHFILDRTTGDPMKYRDLLPLLESLDYPEKGYEEGHLIQLENDTTLVTLEPGSQLELSFACTDDLYAIQNWYAKAILPILDYANQLDYDLVCSGGLPATDPDDVECILKERYAFMDKWFNSHGTRGHEMMKGTASIHVSVDYKDEADFIRKYRMANILHPVFAFLSSNTPHYARRKNEDILLRDSIWQATDPGRTGLLPTLFDADFGFASYASSLLDLPIITMKTEDGYEDAKDLTIREAAQKYGWSEQNIRHFLSMAFWNVRLKQFIEIRSADMMPLPWMMAYAALVKGLFYGTADWSHLANQIQDIQNAGDALRKDGWDANVYGMPVQDLVLDLLQSAKDNLPAAEKALLAPFQELAEKKEHIYETDDGRRMEVIH